LDILVDELAGEKAVDKILRMGAVGSTGIRPRKTIAVVSAALILAGFAGCSSPIPRREDEVAIAEGLVERGEFAAAARVFSAAAANGRPDARLFRRQSEILIRAGRRQDAADPARRAAALSPNDESLQVFAAQVLLSVGRFDEVADRMQAWLDKHPASVDGWIAFGTAKAGLNSPTRALDRLALARTANELQNMSQSGSRRATAAADTVAAGAFQRAMGLAPDTVAARIAWANFLVATQRVEQAVEVLVEVVGCGPTRPVVIHALGTYYWLRGRPAEAETRLKTAATARGYGRRAAATSSLASLYEDAGRKANALAAIRALPPETGVSDAVTLEFARLEARAGELDAALRRLDGLMDRKGQSSGALVVKASLLLDAGRFADAVAAARAAVDLAPNEAEPRTTLAKALASRAASPLSSFDTR
jgi:predicted Zn-dependent protease